MQRSHVIFPCFSFFIVCFLCSHFIHKRWWVKYDAYFWFDVTINLHTMKCNFTSLPKNYSSYKKYLSDIWCITHCNFLLFFQHWIYNCLKYMDSINHFIHPLCQVIWTEHVNKGYGFNSFGKTNNFHTQIYIYIFVY